MTMMLSADSIVMATPRQVGATLDEGAILLHLESGLYFGMENVAARIWKLLENPIRVGEIERVLSEEYEVEPGKCREEVDRLLRELVERDLVEVKNP